MWFMRGQKRWWIMVPRGSEARMRHPQAPETVKVEPDVLLFRLEKQSLAPIFLAITRYIIILVCYPCGWPWWCSSQGEMSFVMRLFR